MKTVLSRADSQIVLLYALFGALWVLVSDTLLGAFVPDYALSATIQTYKGWTFVILSALLIATLLQRSQRQRGAVLDQMRASEEKFSVIFNKAPFAAALAKLPGGTMVDVNQEFERLFGYTRAQVVGKTSLELGMYPDPAERTRSAAKFQAQGFLRDAEIKLQTKSGSVREFAVNTDVVEIGNEKHVLTTARDITERKRVEEALRASEEKFRDVFESANVGQSITLPSGQVFVNAAFAELLGYTRQELANKTWQALTPSDEIDAIQAILTQLSNGEKDAARFTKRYLRKNGAYVWADVSVVVRRGQDGKALYFITTIVDITERKNAQAALEERYRELRAIYDASQQLQQLFAPDVLAQKVIQVLEQILEHAYSSVLLVNEASGALDPFALSTQSRGKQFVQADKAYLASKNVSVGVGITGWVAQHGESVRVDDVRLDARYLPVRDEIRSELCVPLRVRERVIGVVNVESPRPAAYSHEDQRVLETIAAQIAVAIQNAHLLDNLRLQHDRLKELSRQLVQAHESESRAIGRELHDQIGQILTALNLTLELARQVSPALAPGKIAHAQELVGDLQNRVSRLSLQLRPPMLDDLGLVPALLWHINRYYGQNSTQVEFKHSGVESKRFHTEIETTAYRCIQEALTNIERHAHARNVRIHIHAGADNMEIEIQDDGQGFDPVRALEKNRGLMGIRERAHLLGGAFEIESASERGARLLLRLPLEGRVA